MSRLSLKRALKRYSLALQPASCHAGVNQSGLMYQQTADVLKPVGQGAYGVAPLTEDEVRRLPVAHQYSS